MAGVQITGLIKPLNAASFPVWEDLNGLGGYRSAADETDRDAIPANFRKTGMAVFLQDTGITYQLVGGILNANWTPMGVASVPVLAETFYVSPGIVTSPSTFATIQSALNAVTPGQPTMLVLAPTTFTENLSVPHGLNVVLTTYEYVGNGLAAIVGSVTWDVSPNDSLALYGCSISGNLIQQDHGTTNGNASLRLDSCTVNAITSSLTYVVIALNLNGQLDNDCQIGAIANNGNILAQNTTLLGNVTTPSAALITSNLGANLTASTAVIIGCEFVAPSTVTCSVDLYLDEYSAYQARANMTFAGAGTSHLASGTSLQLHNNGTAGATPTLNWKANGALSLTLDQNCVPVFTAPLFSQMLVLTLTQSGAQNWTWTWPANVVNGPTIHPTGESTYLLYWCKETNKVYPYSQA